MCVLDVTGDYRLIRSFLTNSLAAAALEVQQELRTLLTPTNAKESQMKFLPVTVGLLNGTKSLGVDINNEVHGYTGENLLKSPALGDMWSQLNLQERTTRAAELLASATGAISASLDLHVTL